jgi:hypothetical protein
LQCCDSGTVLQLGKPTLQRQVAPADRHTKIKVKNRQHPAYSRVLDQFG